MDYPGSGQIGCLLDECTDRAAIQLGINLYSRCQTGCTVDDAAQLLHGRKLDLKAPPSNFLTAAIPSIDENLLSTCAGAEVFGIPYALRDAQIPGYWAGEESRAAIQSLQAQRRTFFNFLYP